MGQSSAAGVTPHCAGAASPRRNLSEPWPISPKRFHEILRSRSFRNMRSRYGRPGTAVSSGRCPPPHRPPGTSRPRKKTPHDGGVFFYSGKSRISCASAGSRWERDRTRSSHKAGKLLHCHRSHRVSGRCPLPRSARRVPLPHAKRPRTMAVTHRYKKWTMGNRNGSKEARRYSPGLLYCYRFSITTPPGSAGERKKPYLQVSNKARKG